MKTLNGISILLATIALSRIVQAQVLETNPAASPLAATNVSAGDLGPFIPLIQMRDVPITTLIETLARRADINYMIDPKLFPSSDSKGHPIPEPLMTFTLRNITAREVLTRMLNVRNLVLLEDPVTRVARITRINHPTPVVDASLLGMDTNNPVPPAIEIIPLIQFSDVPLDTALENLIRQSQAEVMLDPRITGASHPPDSRFVPAPMVSIRWENLSAKQTIVALCQNYDLIIVKDSATGGLRIEPNPRVKK